MHGCETFKWDTSKTDPDQLQTIKNEVNVSKREWFMNSNLCDWNSSSSFFTYSHYFPTKLSEKAWDKGEGTTKWKRVYRVGP
jgi:Zn-dependent peptidase ImmA (M78 family)